jgi:integrase
MRPDTSGIITTIQPTPIGWSRFRAEFLSPYVVGTTCARNTRQTLIQVFDLVEALDLAVAGEPPRRIETTADLTPALVARFVADRTAAGLAPSTVRGLLMRLRTVCSYAEQNRYVMISPFRLRKIGKIIRVPRPAGKRHLTAEEVRRVLDLMRSDVEQKRGWAQWRARRLLALTATVALTGLRAMEAQCLWVADLELARRVIDLVPRGPRLPGGGVAPARLKTEASAQPVAMPAALVPILEEWLAHRLSRPAGFVLPSADRIPWLFPGVRGLAAWTTGRTSQKPIGRLGAVAKRAGVFPCTWQMLRRTWATRAEALGVPQALITRQARHTDESTTRRWYQQRDVDSLCAAIDGFTY